jgi:3-dehydroquinate synthase
MKIIAQRCNVCKSEHLTDDINELLKPWTAEQVYLLCDTGSYERCRSKLEAVEKITAAHTIVIEQGDDNKDVNAAMQIWTFLAENCATRKSVLINLGGGMVCDLGGFCASTFKRGISFVNIPTTVLAQVDASLGGKTGMNLGSLKNEIGVFNVADTVVISDELLSSLDKEQLLSGYAEMLKHGLIKDDDYLQRLMTFDFDKPDYQLLCELICESIMIKNSFVEADPHEDGVRKALNVGHTIGHAIETMSMRHKAVVPHGYAVAWGMIGELWLSHWAKALDIKVVEQMTSYITDKYGKVPFTEDDFDELLELMCHDKKNDNRGINFTLIPKVGEIAINQIGSPDDIRAALKCMIQ